MSSIINPCGMRRSRRSRRRNKTRQNSGAHTFRKAIYIFINLLLYFLGRASLFIKFHRYGSQWVRMQNLECEKTYCNIANKKTYHKVFAVKNHWIQKEAQSLRGSSCFE
jgi:hypothetical protein